MKKVDVIMTASLDSIIGPVQTIKRIKNNYEFFKENGYDVNIFTSDNLPTTVAAKVRKSNLPIVAMMKKIAMFLSKHSWLYSWYRIRHLFKSSFPLLNYYSSLHRNPDIIVFHSLMDCYIYLKYFKIEGTKIACFTHCDGLLFKMLLLFYPRLLGGCVERKLADIADYVMSNVDVKPCIAKIEEKNLLANYPQLNGKTCLVVNAIDDLTDEQKESILKIKKNYDSPFKYRMVSTGSVQRRKGQFTIVQAMNDLPENILKNIHLDIIGDGPDRAVIEDYILNNPRLQSHVCLLGSVKNTDVFKKLAYSNIMILMSVNEGLPISLIEGLRSGLALISTNVSGIPELINDNVNGKLLNPCKEELVDLLYHIGDYAWDDMGKSSRKLFEDYYVFSRMRNDYLNMLNKAFVKYDK